MQGVTRALGAAVLAGIGLGGVVQAQRTMLPPAIAHAASDPARAAEAPDDARRHGPEILAFAGVKPGDRVLDLMPGGGYWTRLFAGTVGPQGHVYGIWPAPLAAHDRKDEQAYAAAAGTAWPNVSFAEQAPAALSVPAKVDLVFTAQNYHDYLDGFMGPVDPAVFDKAVFDALKPGGVFLVIDHVALPGSGTTATEKLHRIDPALVKAQVTAAGFRFVGASALLANSADDHTRLVFDPVIRGHTDQFVYKFRKPL